MKPRWWWTAVVVLQGTILAVILGVHYRHVLDRLVRIWSSDGDWSHGFIIPLFSIYYLYMQRDRLPWGLAGGRVASRFVGGLLLAAGFACYVGSTLYRYDYPKNIALVTSVMGMVLMVCGWPVAR